MKTRLIFPVLAIGALVLLAAIGVLTYKLLEVSVPPVERPSVPVRPAKQHAPAVAEVRIEVGGDEDARPAPPKKAAAAVSAGRVPAAPATPPKPQSAPAEKAPELIGVIAQLKGYAFAAGPGGQMRPLNVNSRIYLNDKVQTGLGATLKIKFDDGTTVSQGENSIILVDQYVYNPQNKKETGFGLCVLKGACHVISGLITDVNPERFKVRTRLATLGIRGCELAFRSKPEREDLYILSLSGKEKVIVETTENGARMLNVVTAEEIKVDAMKMKLIEVVESGTVISIVEGGGPSQRRIDLDETTRIVSESTGLTPALHNIKLTQDGALFTVQPREKGASEDEDKKK